MGIRYFGQSNCETDTLRKGRGERAEHLGNLWNVGKFDAKSGIAAYDVQAPTRWGSLRAEATACTPNGFSGTL
jgi:hypothetical protein